MEILSMKCWQPLRKLRHANCSTAGKEALQRFLVLGKSQSRKPTEGVATRLVDMSRPHPRPANVRKL